MRISLLAVLLAGLVWPGEVSAQAETPQATDALLPGDVVQIEIWREDDLSGEYIVDENGFVVLPLLGPTQVTDFSPRELRDFLIDGYNEYLVNTSVNITLLRRVNVLGEVQVPGQYLVDATQSIAGLIAQAQGITPEGDADDIRLVRDGVATRTDLSGTLSIQQAGIRSGDQIVVGQRSWFSRNFSSVVGIASIIANIVVIAGG